MRVVQFLFQDLIRPLSMARCNYGPMTSLEAILGHMSSRFFFCRAFEQVLPFALRYPGRRARWAASNYSSPRPAGGGKIRLPGLPTLTKTPRQLLALTGVAMSFISVAPWSLPGKASFPLYRTVCPLTCVLFYFDRAAYTLQVAVHFVIGYIQCCLL